MHRTRIMCPFGDFKTGGMGQLSVINCHCKTPHKTYHSSLKIDTA